MEAISKYELVVGLEVHVQLQTQSKLFCGDSTFFGADANTQVSSVSLAHPGTLPVLNTHAVDLAVRLGLALESDINRHHVFARKNYFYPDLPKGFQISQHTAPVCRNGRVTINTTAGAKNILLHHMHLEEDAGKSLHDVYDDFTCIDLNRAGMPLLEIVTEPVMHSSEEAYAFLTELRRMVRWLGVCDGNMEEGSMRCDANISIRPIGSTVLGTRVEVKNLNSIRNVKKAIEIEFDRLVKLTEQRETIFQETRSFDADRQITFSLRTKESADDYRYFPEPDLPPFFISDQRLEIIRSDSPALPAYYLRHYTENLGLSDYDAAQLCADKEEHVYYEKLIAITPHNKAAANWLLGPVRAYCNTQSINPDQFPLSPNVLAVLIDATEFGKVSFQNASGPWMNFLIKNPEINPKDALISLNLEQQSDEASIEKWIDEVKLKFPEKLKDYQSGKKALLGMFAGEVKKMSKGKADMQIVQRLLSEKLKP